MPIDNVRKEDRPTPASQIDDLRLCRVCGEDLKPGPSRRIGVCPWCVANPRFEKIRIPSARYENPARATRTERLVRKEEKR